MRAITLGIVEDNIKIIQALSLLFEEGGVHVMSVFTSAEEALAKLPQNPPAILLVDLGLPGIDGTELIRQLKAKIPHMDMMVLTVFDEKEKVFDSLKAGATGYILKDDSPDQILAAIHELHRGGAPMSKKIAKYVLEEFRKRPFAVKKVDQDFYALSEREKDVLTGLARGLTYHDLAAQLNLGTETVKTHIKKIYHKLQVSSKMEAVNKAMEEGLL